MADKEPIAPPHAGGEQHLRLLLEQVPAVVWTTDRDLRFTASYGKGLAGLRVGINQVVGTTLLDFFGGDAENEGLRAHDRALEGFSDTFEQTWLGRTFQTHVDPLHDDEGRLIGTVGVALDVTARKHAEQTLRGAHDALDQRVRERTRELSAANAALTAQIGERAAMEENLRRSEQRLEGILNAQATLIGRADLKRHVTYMNQAYADAFGLHLGDEYTVKIHPEDTPLASRAVARLFEQPYASTVEIRCLVKGEWRWIYWQNSVNRGPDGSIVELQAVGFDVTERRRAEEALRRSQEHFRELADSNRRLLMEVDHRVRNNLAGLLSLVSLMRNATQDVSKFASAIEARLTAMNHVHQLMAEGGWRAVEVGSLVRSLLAAMERLAVHHAKVSASGPPVLLPPAQVLPLAMIVVEWFTNSCKYGAHSAPGCRLFITWETLESEAGPRLRLQWHEEGTRVHPPEQTSLGTELVNSFATRELGGTVSLAFPETGVHHVLEFPVSVPGDAPQNSEPVQPASAKAQTL